MSVSIKEVSNNTELNRFIKIPWRIYENYPNWVPPLIIDQKFKFNTKKNPFFKHSEAKLYIAEKNGSLAGRIAAIINNNHNRIHEENIGFFGFFESINDREVSDSLFNVAAEYLKSKGLTAMRGPANFSSNDDWGLLVDAFDKPPVVMMSYNPAYYLDLIEGFGFKKKIDLYAYWMHQSQMTDRLMKAAEAMKKRTRIHIRKLNMKDFWGDVTLIKSVYNSAWLKNWGFIPMTDSEFNHTAKDMKLIVDPDLALIAEYEGKPIGFSLALPDINQALIRLNGRLFPFGLLKLLYYKRKIHSVRVLTMGVVEEFRNRGIDLIFYYETFKNGTAKGYDSGEFSWMLETNDAMNRMAKNMGSEVYKRYRLYDFNFA